MQDINKQINVIATAAGIHGNSSACAVSRFAASLPYSEVIKKNGYDIG